MLKAVIFDMDGVLVDSPKYIRRAFDQLLENYGVKRTKEERKKATGLSLRDKIKIWKEDHDIKEEIDPKEFSKKSFEIELKLMQKELKPNKDVLSLINELKNNNIKIAVATSSTSERAEKILELIEVKKQIDILITSEDVENHKPNPDIFLKAANELNTSPEECVVIEDAPNGIEAGNKANMKTIALLTESHSKEDFQNKPNLIINKLSELEINTLNNLINKDN